MYDFDVKRMRVLSFLYFMMADEYGRVTSGQFQYLFLKTQYGVACRQVRLRHK